MVFFLVHTLSKFGSAILAVSYTGNVLDLLQLVRYASLCPRISLGPETKYEARSRALKGRYMATEKPFKGPGPK